MSNIETRGFKVSPAIIVNLIKAQAGSCGKAVAESLMNSIDAGASKVCITVDKKGMSIVDNGHGFRTREEILACFEVFGFDHSEHKREFGRFGLGRGQMWNYASTVWRSNEFALHVDVRNKGLDYDLESGLEPVRGVTIEATFYTALDEVGLLELNRDIKRLCKYSAVPVELNGVVVSEDPAAKKWDFEDEDCYIKITEGSHLAVYSQGLFVTDIYAGTMGVAGTVITKRGRALVLNMARNDILRAECELFGRIQKQCAKIAAARRGKEKAKRLTNDDRAYMAAQTANPENIELLEQKIFTLTNGRHLSFSQLVAGAGLAAAPSGDRIAEKIMRSGQVRVLAEATLDRFNCATIEELVTALIDRLELANSEKPDHMLDYKLRLIRRTTWYPQLADVPAYAEINNAVIPYKDLTKQQQAILHALDDASRVSKDAVEMRQNGGVSLGGWTAPRKLRLATSEGCEAFTDGRSYIAIVDEVAEAAVKQGLSGWFRLTALLVHEYLHDSDDTGSHSHDQEFYEVFHDVMLDSTDALMKAAIKAMRYYTKSTGKLTINQARELDLAS